MGKWWETAIDRDYGATTGSCVCCVRGSRFPIDVKIIPELSSTDRFLRDISQEYRWDQLRQFFVIIGNCSTYLVFSKHSFSVKMR